MAAAKQQLPPKENALFKSIVKHYETKQYKKGLKAAETILKKFADHGETLAMKGLILNCMDKKSEAYEFVRKGLKNDLKSHVCWHVYGLLYRSDRDYMEAIKCYRNALRIDKENIQILRDLSLLQIQMRDLKGFLETRRTLLTLKPTNRNNWIGFALSNHLLSRHKRASDVVEAYEKTLEGAPENDYEHSEMLLYKNMLLEEGDDLSGALEHLKSSEKLVVDKLFAREKKAQLHLQLEKFEDAMEIYRELLKINSENYRYHAGLQAACLKLAVVKDRSDYAGLTEEQEGQLHNLYNSLQSMLPKCTAAKRIPLDFLSAGPRFQEAVAVYLKPGIRKGVPSLFADLKRLHKDPDKVKIFEQVLTGWVECLRTQYRFKEGEAEESPACYMWTLFLLAQHYDQRAMINEALDTIDLAIEHTPTLIDLYVFKGRIFKHAGDVQMASQMLEEARKMDLADRYLNTKSTRYLLRSDQLDTAHSTISLFTKDGEQHNNLFDMQCMWYELEAGDSYIRQQEYGKALKKYTAVEQHFTDIVEDQFDFHTYCVRKMTLRAYVRLLRMEDRIWGHKFFCRAARGIIHTYLLIHERPKTTQEAQDDERYAGMTPEERKKAESKARRAEKKAKAEADQKAAEEARSGGGKDGKDGKKKSAKASPVDEDPDGKALADVDNPLEKATNYLRIMQKHADTDLQTHILACHLFMRKEKFLLVLQSLLRAVALAKDKDAEVHKCIVRFFHTIDEQPALDPTVAKVVAAQRNSDKLLRGNGLEQYNEAFLNLDRQSVDNVMAAAEMMLLLSPARKAEARGLLMGLDSTRLNQAIAIHQLLVGPFADPEAADAYKKQCQDKFRQSTYFKDTSGEAPKVQEG